MFQQKTDWNHWHLDFEMSSKRRDIYSLKKHWLKFQGKIWNLPIVSKSEGWCRIKSGFPAKILKDDKVEPRRRWWCQFVNQHRNRGKNGCPVTC